jgi:hypothetical protein
VFFGLLLFTSLACDLSLGDPAEIVPPALETAEEAARVAGNVAQTAAAQAGDLAGTAAVVATTEGGKLIATAIAMATPHADYLKDKLASLEPDADGNYRVTLTENEVNTLLRLRQLLTGDLLGAGIQSQEVKFRDGSITLSGTILEPLPGRLFVRMRPSVEAGQIQLDIQESSLAGQAAPQQALEAAEGAITGGLGEILEFLPADVQLQEVTVANGEIVITGRKITSE